MWWLYNTSRKTWIICVDGVEAGAMNRLQHDFPWLETRKRYTSVPPF